MSPFPRRIGVGFDGSEPARRALERVADVAGDEATVFLVTVAQPLYPDPPAGEPVDPCEAAKRDRMLAQGKDLLAQRGVAARTRPALGDPAQTILEVAREANSDLVVVGNRGRGRVARIALGSVSSTVVHQADRAVLVVR
jgi:nucleotide-binding universal stress UspA family protein